MSTTEATTSAALIPPPKRTRPYFPGWTMVGVSAAAQYMSGPGQSYSVAAFKEPMRATLAVSETDYSLAYGAATLLSGITLPLTGWLIDHFGARRMLPIIAGLLGVACVVMSRTVDLAGLYLGFSMIRCLGQGALSLVAMWMIGEWFLRRRGLATSLSGLGGSISVMTLPLINGVLIGRYGWQTTWTILGAAVALSLVIPSWLLIRDRPEDLGLEPDGEESDTHSALDTAELFSGAPAFTTDSWSLIEVLRDPTFWKLLSVPVSSGMIGTGMIFHQVSLLATHGVPSHLALGLISLQAAVATVAAVGAGWLTDRWPSQHLLAVAMILLSSSVLIVYVMPHPMLAIGYAACMGLHGSILRSAGTVVWVNYYGRQNQGKIRGVAMSMMIFAAAAGPIPLAVARDRLQDYAPVLVAFILIPLLAALLVMSAKTPVRRRSHET